MLRQSFIGPTLNNFRPALYAWIIDCTWLDAEGPEDMVEVLDSMSDEKLIAGLNRHYAGGFIQFIKDSQLN